AKITTYVSKCLTCAKVKTKHQKLSGLLQHSEIQVWKWDRITMDYITGLPRTPAGPLEFDVGDKVMLKVSSRKGVISFGKHRKLNLQYSGPFKVLERIGPVEYKLELPKELQGIHNTFHVLDLKKFLSNENLVIPLDIIRLDDKLYFINEPVDIMDRKVKQLKQSRILIVKAVKIAALKAEMAKINKNLMKVLQVNQQVKALTPRCETCGGPHSFFDCPVTVGDTQNVYAARAYQGNSYQPQGNRNLLSYRSDNYLGPQGNRNFLSYRNNHNQNFHNQNKNQGNHHPQGNNQRRNQFFQEANHGQNQPPAYQAPAYQALANDAILKNMKTNMTSLTNSNLELKNMFGQFMKMNTASSSGSGTLPGNIITNPKEDLKGITNQSGTAYQGPTIPTSSSSLPPVVERKTEATKDTVHPTNNGSTEDVQPPIVPTESLILNSEPVISPIIEPVASLREIFQIFKDLNFNISFANALIQMPKFGPSIKSMLTNKDKLCELTRTPLNEHCSTVLLKKLPEKLGGSGKFLIPCDFPGMAECLALADLGASINLMPLSVWNKLSLTDLSPMCMTLKLANCSISRPVRVAEDVFVKVGTFDFQVDFVVVDFDADPRVPLILGRYFLKTGRDLIDVFEEVELKDLPPHLEYVFLEGDDKLPDIIAKDLSVEEKTALITVLKSHKRAIAWKLSDIKGIDPEFYTHKILMEEDFEPAEKSHFMVKEGIVLGHKISKEGIEVDKAKVDVIAKVPHPTTVKECVEAFQTLKRKLTEAPLLIALDWDMPFELMCDASDFAIGAVLGQRQDKHFRPIHYASKTMTEAKSSYTTTEKEMLAMVKVQLNELRDQAYENSLIYKEKTKRIHDLKIKDCVFNIGDRVLFFNIRLKIFSSKLKSCWSGPFTISHVFPYGTVELSQPDMPNFKVNRQRLKHYFGEDIPKMVVPDL
nr:hypothetical protein [Tanacetum cinerariifolium]